MQADDTQFTIRLARDEEDLRAAQRLRYTVFVEELGGDGPLVDHDQGLERDRFDAFYDHLVLADEACGGEIVGVYRVMRHDQAKQAGQFYSEDEYDLSTLKTSGRRIMELGRSCLAEGYRGGVAMFHLWNGLARYVAEHGIEILFGVASFHGTNTQDLRQPLSLLHHRHLAPEALRVTAMPDHFQRMDLLPEAEIDRRAAMLQMPALIKAYLRLGGFVGQGAFVDHAFNTIDVCLVMDTARLSARQKSIYAKGVDL
ncbi:MAG: GNAT family N-acyltransferase [Pseudomonadota bacterium]